MHATVLCLSSSFSSYFHLGHDSIVIAVVRCALCGFGVLDLYSTLTAVIRVQVDYVDAIRINSRVSVVPACPL